MSRPIAVIDAETDPFRKGRIPQPFIWGYYDGYRYKTFANAKTLATFLRRESRIVYAHNGGKFDFHYLLSELDPYSDLTIINGRIAACHIGNAELRDSFCIIPQGLGKYKKDDIDYALMESNRRRFHMDEIKAYLRNDCIYLYEMVSAFVAQFGPQLTLAGAAMKQWQRISDEQGIEQCERTDEEFYNELSPYYYGGRVQCFRSGIVETDFNVFDINSAYPYAMLHKHPYSAQFERITGYARDADFYHVSCISFGALPYRGGGATDNVNFGLSFPNDDIQRDFYITAWEFDAAKATKSIAKVRVIESLRFAGHVDFAPYINHWWREREKAKKAGDELQSLFCKLLMNSLYGKFAANPDNYANYMNVPMDRLDLLTTGGKWKFGGELGPWALGECALDDYARRYYNVATGASITGFVRAMLWRAIHSSKGVLYCDTDSIAVEKKGSAVVLSNALGDWKDEGRFDKAGIAGKKLYIFRGVKENGKRQFKTASKGVRLSDAQLWRVASGATVTYKTEHPTYSVKSSPRFVNREIRKTA